MWICCACGNENNDDSVRCVCGNEDSSKSETHNPQILTLPWSSVTLTTAPFLEGFRVEETIEIVTSECVFGMNMFKDFFTSMTDFFGGRSHTIQNTLRDARKVCLEELRKEAHYVGANAVIAIDLDYSEFSGQGKSMLFMVASGTAVKVAPMKNSVIKREFLQSVLEVE